MTKKNHEYYYYVTGSFAYDWNLSFDENEKLKEEKGGSHNCFCYTKKDALKFMSKLSKEYGHDSFSIIKVKAQKN